jgi:alkylated DNA repair dioxygenase AlkB
MNNRYAITFGEVAILHIGGKEYGKGRLEHGFTTTELKKIAEENTDTEYISISDKLPRKLRNGNDAGVLIFRSISNNQNNKDKKFVLGLNKKEADKLYLEQETVEYDQKYWDNRRSKTLNKRARYNIVFGKNKIEHSKDYKQCSIAGFSDLKYLNKFRKRLKLVLGNKTKKLNAEGNKYFHDKAGIGYHGDAERKIVICLSLGKPTTLRYHWRLPGSSDHKFEPTDINLNHGDVYIMSEKATGYDWKSRSKVRVVHGAGNSYI